LDKHYIYHISAVKTYIQHVDRIIQNNVRMKQETKSSTIFCFTLIIPFRCEIEKV